MCGMTAAVARSFSARTVSQAWGRVRRQPCGRAAHRHVRACRQMVKFGRRRAGDALATGWEVRRRDVRPPSDWNFSNKKPAADFSARALSVLAMMLLYP